MTFLNRLMFAGLRDVEELFLDNNRIVFVYDHPITLKITAFSLLKHLRILDLHNNLIGKTHRVRQKVYDDGSYDALLEVDACWVLGDHCKILNLSNNSIQAFKWYKDYNKVKHIDLRFNRVLGLSFATMEVDEFNSVFESSQIEFNLADSDRSRLIIEQNDEKNYIMNHKVLLNNNVLECEGDSFFELIRGWRSKHYELEFGAQKCEKPDYMTAHLMNNLTTTDVFKDLPPYCIEDCRCLMQIETNLFSTNCSHRRLYDVPEFEKLSYDLEQVIKYEILLNDNQLTSLPNILNLKKKIPTIVDASNNQIFELRSDNFHDKTELLDISGNNFTTIPPLIFEQLMRISNVSLLLSRNPWACDCLAVDFLQSIKEYKKIIKDYEFMSCSDGRLFKDLTASDICFQTVYLITLLGSILGFTGMIFSVFYKFQKNIKIWLYAQNMCLWFVSEEELDEDKIYDAFVVFASPDQFLVEDLVLRLEAGPNPYKCCVGIRDWQPGNLFSKLVSKHVVIK